MDRLVPEIADKIVSPIRKKGGKFPRNFQFAKVLSIEKVNKIFLRIILKCEDLVNYNDKSMHFRLILPPKGIKPKWPSVAANGSTKWPVGAHTLHKPVYTARFVKYKENTIITDVFMHEGGRTTKWAKEVSQGDTERNRIAIVGPVGNGLLASNKVLIASDETGFPAAARILENLTPMVEGELIFETQDGSALYPFECPQLMRIRWLSRDKGENLKDETIKAISDNHGAKIWFAGEKEQANLVREEARNAGWGKEGLRISGFWSTKNSI